MNGRNNIDRFCKGDAKNFLAEVFFKELQFVCGESLLDRLVVVNHGMNSRVRSRDVLGVRRKRDFTESSREDIVLHLSRNGIYQQLPEFLFHPISISLPSMSNKEVVEAIRENKRKEKEAVRFFSPFDTETFKEDVQIYERHLSMFDHPYTDKNLKKISSLFYSSHAPLTQGERYRFLLFLCRSENLKENLAALENVIYTVIRLRVDLRYKRHYINQLPYESLGSCHLGSDAGLEGPLVSELDDVEAKIYFEEIVDEHILEEKIDTVKFILSFFILSSRHVDVIYTIVTHSEFILGQNYLGYDSNL